jgi:hypothetical protein
MNSGCLFNLPNSQRTAINQMARSLAQEPPLSVRSPHRHHLDPDRLGALHDRLAFGASAAFSAASEVALSFSASQKGVSKGIEALCIPTKDLFATGDLTFAGQLTAASACPSARSGPWPVVRSRAPCARCRRSRSGFCIRLAISFQEAWLSRRRLGAAPMSLAADYRLTVWPRWNLCINARLEA